jgi:hypothetical protein
MGSSVASGKMLLSDRRRSRSEEQHDEPEKHVSTRLRQSTTECELLEVVRPRYLKASKVQNHLKRKTKTYKTVYRGEVAQALEQIWAIYVHICSKRLQLLQLGRN